MEESPSPSLSFSLGTEFKIVPKAFYGSMELVFSYDKHIDTRFFNQGTPYFVPSIDIRNSKQFSYTNRGMIEELKDSEKVASLKKYTSNPDILRYLDQIIETHLISPVDHTALRPIGYHGGIVTYIPSGREFLDIFRRPVDLIEKMKKDGVYGRSNGVTYVTSDFDVSLTHAKTKPDVPLVLLTLDMKKLAEKRNIFIDPESLRISDEFMTNFVVHNGIPVSAIKSLDILRLRSIT